MEPSSKAWTQGQAPPRAAQCEGWRCAWQASICTGRGDRARSRVKLPAVHRRNRHTHLHCACALLALVAGAACSGGGTKKPVVAVDARVPDPVDARVPDARVTRDAGTDSGKASELPDDGSRLPTRLSETGLYEPGSTTELASGVMPYSVRYALWSDGAEKQRWLYLPPGTQIDSSDMDAWVFPVGTKVWKEFSLDGKRLETRLLWKNERGWFRMAFAWSEDGSDALAARVGADDVAGTTHDIPSRSACGECHDGAKDVLLGVSAIQLSHPPNAGVTLQDLAAEGLLSQPPADGDIQVPATDEWQALGYLHANCGNCHNPASITWDRVDLDLSLGTDELSGAIADTHIYKSSVDVHLTSLGGDLTLRVAPGDAEHSGLLARMTTRGSDKAMPPLASEVVDPGGVALVRKWIDSL